MKTRYISAIVATVLLFSSCEKFLDRPPLTSLDDKENAWISEELVRLYANKFYTEFFVGYESGFSGGGSPLLGYTNNDDMVILGNQINFTRSVPNSSIWDYGTIVSLNLMLDRIEEKMTDILKPEEKAHWVGVGRFFRGFRYAQMVQSFGDIPYYDHVVSDLDLDALYKPRDSRNVVMNAVYEDWKFAMQNIRLSDGEQNLNRYIAAGFISRLALQEASWQRYYYNDQEQAVKFYELAIEASNLVMLSGKYFIEKDYKTLFTSKDLKGNKEIILHRIYDGAIGVTHSVASAGNLSESTNNGPSSDLIKSYLCTDGSTWENSTVVDAEKFDLTNLIKTRDPRLEATFYSKPNTLNRSSLFYITKYFPREIEKMVKIDGIAIPAEYTGNKNETDAPVLRYAEVILNWIEAKAEMATLGGAALTQDDIDKSINKLRARPVHPEADARGVKQVASLSLSAIPNDPNRDVDVSPILWEIRREKRLEFVFETFRLSDLRRWSKLEYVDNAVNTDLLSGGWVNFTAELPSELAPKNIGVLAVVTETGQEIVYNGSNGALMNGFYKNTINKPRLPFLNQANINPYLTPIGLNQLNEYTTQGYVLKQTEGWPQN